jgi:hypothetical protein
VIAVLLVAAPVTASPAVNPEAHPASIEFALEANNGLLAQLEADSEGVDLKISRKGRTVSYKVQGESTEAGLKARFGQLGSIDVAFKPTKTQLERPPKGCKGSPSTDSEGVFVGTIEFNGEFEYVQIAATQAEERCG